MKLPIIKRLMKGDIPETPGWFDPILNTLNTFMERVILVLSNRITFADNMACEIKELTFTNNTELQFSTSLKTITGAFPVGFPAGVRITGFNFRIVQSGVLGATVTFSSGTTGLVKIIILG